MTRTRTALTRALLPVLAAAVATLASLEPAWAADAQRQIDRTTAATSNLRLELHNLAGNVTVVPTDGKEVKVAATVHASAASAAEAERIAGLLQLSTETVDNRWIVKAVYPLDESRKYCYPRQAQEEELPWFLNWLDIGSSSFKYADREVRVVSQPGSGALTLYADFRIEIPAGVAVKVKDGIGAIDSQNVRGDQTLDIATGEVEVKGGTGALSVDTGSGDVRVARQAGDVLVDTGSGDVHLEQVAAKKIDVDTGSGDIEIRQSTGALSCDTGSGDIVGEELALGGSIYADTGSGDVRISGDFSAVASISIDAGSGDVFLEASAGKEPQVNLDVSTGSGEITFDMPASRILRQSRDELRATIGQASGTAEISTGSGDVVLRTRR